MLWRPGPESTRSTLTCPTSAARNRQSAPCSSSWGAQSAWPASEAIGRWCRPSHTSPASPRPVPAEITAAFPVGAAPTGLEDGEVAVRQRRESPRVRLEVVDQDHASETQPAASGRASTAQGRFVASTRPSWTGPGDPDARVRERPRRLAQERRHDLVETLVLLAGIGTCDARHQATPGDLEPGQAGVRAADVAREDHGRTTGAHREATPDDRSGVIGGAVTRPCTSAALPAG